MNQQLALTFEPVRSRSRDPETSQRAGRNARQFAAGHFALILDALADDVGRTYKQIAERCGLEQHAVARRLKEMEAAGLVRRKEVGRNEKGVMQYVEANGCAIWWKA